MNNKNTYKMEIHTYRVKVYKVKYICVFIRLKNYTHVICTYIPVSKQFFRG